MFGIYDTDYTLIAGPFNDAADALVHAVTEGVPSPFLVREM